MGHLRQKCVWMPVHDNSTLNATSQNGTYTNETDDQVNGSVSFNWNEYSLDQSEFFRRVGHNKNTKINFILDIT